MTLDKKSRPIANFPKKSFLQLECVPLPVMFAVYGAENARCGHAEFARKTALGNRPKLALMEFVIEKMGSWKMSEIFCRKMSYEKLCCWKMS